MARVARGAACEAAAREAEIKKQSFAAAVAALKAMEAIEPQPGPTSVFGASSVSSVAAPTGNDASACKQQ